MPRATARTSTTVVAVVGDGAAECVRAAGPRRPTSCRSRSTPTTRRSTAPSPPGRRPARAHTPYFVHDADPLAAVADAWVRRFDEEGPIGELEVAVAETLARWRVGSIELPDYYLVLDAERGRATRRHWYLGVLHTAAPARVVPVPDPDAAARMLPRLGAGAWWPDLDDCSRGSSRSCPISWCRDPLGLLGAASA